MLNNVFGRENQAALLLDNPGAEMHSYKIVKPVRVWVELVTQSFILMIAFHFAVTVFIKTTFIQRKGNLIRVASS